MHLYACGIWREDVVLERAQRKSEESWLYCCEVQFLSRYRFLICVHELWGCKIRCFSFWGICRAYLIIRWKSRLNISCRATCVIDKPTSYNARVRCARAVAFYLLNWRGNNWLYRGGYDNFGLRNEWTVWGRKYLVRHRVRHCLDFKLLPRSLNKRSIDDGVAFFRKILLSASPLFGVNSVPCDRCQTRSPLS